MKPPKDNWQRLRKYLGLKPGEPKFVNGHLEPRTPVRIILNGEGQVADAIATGQRAKDGKYVVWYKSRSGRKTRLELSRYYVMYR